MSDTFQHLTDYLRETSKLQAKFSIDANDLMKKPLKVFLKQYKHKSLDILYRIRKLQSTLAVEYKKAREVISFSFILFYLLYS